MTLVPAAQAKGINIVTARTLRRILYFQSARMRRIQQDYLQMWRFFLRARAIGDVSDGCLADCERQFLLDATLKRIFQRISDFGVSSVQIDNTPFLLALKARLESMLPSVQFSMSTSDLEKFEFRLVETFFPAPKAKSSHR